MNESENKTQNPSPEIPEKVGTIELDKIFKMDEVSSNSIICYKIQDIGKWIIPVLTNFETKYGKMLKEKNISLLVMREKDSIETVTESQLNKMGWYKKGKIITL
jgi:hypothetical protein